MKNYYKEYKIQTPTEYNKVFQQLIQERQTFIPHWKEVVEHIVPTKGRFFLDDVNRGNRKNQKIIDSTATYSLNILASGMMSGVTSPSRQWFRLGVSNPMLEKQKPVRDWLDEVTNTMLGTFIRSNLYNTLPITYRYLGSVGTDAMLIERDSENVMRCYSFPIGSYIVASNSMNKVDTFGREFKMTVRQIVEKFAMGPEQTEESIDWSNISDHVKMLYTSNQHHEWIPVRHLIKPNPDFEPGSANPKKFRFISCYWENGGSGKGQQNSSTVLPKEFLSKKGYKYFPVLCSRWEANTEDAYATNSPGMTALGDIKQLQHGEKMSAMAIQKQVNAPMVGGPDLEEASLLPGGITISRNPDQFREAQQVRLSIQDLEFKQNQCRDRIKKDFYVDLFLMLANTERSQITATEIKERYEEKLLALGPVLQQLNQDLLDPLIDIAFELHLEAGLIPEPPEELQGQPLKVEYISIMAQAQKMAGINVVDRFTSYYQNMMSIDPSTRHKVKPFELLNVYADYTGIPSKIMRTDNEAEALARREMEIQMQQQQAAIQAQQAQALANQTQAVNNIDNEEQQVSEMIRQTLGV